MFFHITLHANRCCELVNEVGPGLYFCHFQQSPMADSTFKAAFYLKCKFGWHQGCRLPWKRQSEEYNQQRAKSEGSRWTSSWRDPLPWIPRCQQNHTKGSVLRFLSLDGRLHAMAERRGPAVQAPWHHGTETNTPDLPTAKFFQLLNWFKQVWYLLVLVHNTTWGEFECL